VSQAPASRTCTKCKKHKPAGAFYFASGGYALTSWCRVCTRLGSMLYQQTDLFKAKNKVYRARPEVMEARRQAENKRRARPENQARRRAYNATPLAKVLSCRRRAKRRLAEAETDARKVALALLIAGYNREIDRIRAKTGELTDGEGAEVRRTG
jgi:hypothetical protein